jgi:hypothetical protein
MMVLWKLSGFCEFFGECPRSGDSTIDAIIRRTRLQQTSLDALDVDTRAWTRPPKH